MNATHRVRRIKPYWAFGLFGHIAREAFDDVWCNIPAHAVATLNHYRPAMREVRPDHPDLDGGGGRLLTRVNKAGRLEIVVWVSDSLSLTQATYVIAHELAHVCTMYPQMCVQTGANPPPAVRRIWRGFEEELTDYLVYSWGFADQMRALVRTGLMAPPGWWSNLGESTAVTGEAGLLKMRSEGR